MLDQYGLVFGLFIYTRSNEWTLPFSNQLNPFFLHFGILRMYIYICLNGHHKLLYLYCDFSNSIKDLLVDAASIRSSKVILVVTKFPNAMNTQGNNHAVVASLSSSPSSSE
mmetsp:Transcript_24789/g.38223  ORF Transcript_24789/g.38223 Transcript_24789/m.38223 type:complete len:111 (-) Transcript_24789:264-596(-)